MAGIGKYKIRGRFYLILAAFITLLVLGIVSLCRALIPVRVEFGYLQGEITAESLIVRQEQVLNYQEYARLDPIAAEGSQVTAGQAVATLYTTGYSPKDLTNLMNLQQTIKDYQTNNILKSVVDQDMTALENEIAENLKEISRALDEDHPDALLGLEQKLCDTMERRRVYMNTSIQADSHLDTLYQQQENLQSRIDANKVMVLSPMDGVLSYLIDGYETVLRPDMMQQCSVSQVESILDTIHNGGLDSTTRKDADGNSPVYRVVQQSPWYLMMLLPKSDCVLKAGDRIYVSVEGYARDVEAYVVDVKIEKGSALVILEVKDPVSSMLSLRRVTVHLGQSREGLRVSRSMVASDETGIYVLARNADGKKEKMYITVLDQDEQSIIFSSEVSGELLKEGTRVYAP